ncbi:MAG: anti-sigma F factor [Oscillospiraceae bacterium]|nr:anti-sigma F factor [Oscillospiraceae bacterium]
MKRKLINECIMRFPAISRNESLSRSASAAFAAQSDPVAADIAAVKIAVSEAVTNAVVHAYPDEAGSVEMIMRLYEGGFLRIIIKDKGKGISDVEQAMKPEFTTAPESEERSGLGFTVMSSFMDSVKVRSAEGKGTSVTLEKQLSTYENEK